MVGHISTLVIRMSLLVDFHLNKHTFLILTERGLTFQIKIESMLGSLIAEAEVVFI